MAISAASNIDSVRIQRQLNKTTDALSRTMERLASGLRINHASDDPAGIGMANSLDNQARVAAVAIRNANDGLSITSIADSALNEVGSILSRMAELATQSANGVYTNVQRSALASEFLALGSEIERIAATTSFNGVNLISSPPEHHAASRHRRYRQFANHYSRRFGFPPGPGARPRRNFIPKLFGNF